MEPVEIFHNVSTAFCTAAVCRPLCKIITDVIPGKPRHWGLNARGVTKYSDVVGHVEGYIVETVKDTVND